MPSKRFLFILMSFTMAAVLAAFGYLEGRRIPPFDFVRNNFRSSERMVLDRYGRLLNESRVDKTVRRLEWVRLEQVPESFINYLLIAEDKRFMSHHGVDLRALGRVARGIIRREPEGGGSTLTMQLASMLTNRLKNHRRRGAIEKLDQMGLAWWLESRWSKAKILEAYINLIYFRGELQGLSAASFGLFNKAVYALTPNESAVLVALIRAPNASEKVIAQRACRIMVGEKTCPYVNSNLLAGIGDHYFIKSPVRLASHVAQKLMKLSDPKETPIVKSTLDYRIQRFAQKTLREQIAAHKSQNMGDGAVIVIENATGNVLAYVANIGTQSKAQYVDAITAERQAGSTLKPFLYAHAIERKLLTAATILKDSPLEISVESGLYRPQNFDRNFKDLVTVRSALAGSLNVPAVKTIEMTGVFPFVATLSDLGMQNLRNADFYGPSLALGSADVRLIDLANAYRTLANGGLWSPINFQPSPKSATDSRRVFSEETAFIIGDILSDRESRAYTFGLENTLSTPFWTAVKTGTSKDMRDNWCVGYSSAYTVGVWAGNLAGDSMWNISGVQGAAPVWAKIMAELHKEIPSVRPQASTMLVQKDVTFGFSKQHKQEWFIAGTEPNVSVIVAEDEKRSRISYPIDGTVVAVDPDIPQENHRLFVQVTDPKPNQKIFINGKSQGPAQKFFGMTPQRGKYVVELRGQEGQVLDEVQFVVRGR